MIKKLRFTRGLALAAFVILMLTPGLGWGQLITYDNFNYADNSLLTANGWVAHSGSGTAAITVGATNGLTYVGYSGLTGITAAVTGNAAKVVNNGEDDSKTFTAVTTGTIYYAFLVNVTSGTSGYFIHLGGSASTFAAKLWVKPSATAGKINFGTSNGSTAVYAATPTDFDLFTTYLIIFKYDVTTTGNISLWVKSTGIPNTEVAAGTPEVTASGSGLASIDRVCLRQYSASQSMLIDGIRVGPTWADVLPSSVIGAPTKLVVTSVNGGSSPTSGVPFSVAVQAQDEAGLPQPVTSDVNLTLSGTGIGGTTTGTILSGQNSITISGVTMSEGYGLTITATQTSGTPALTAGISTAFNVTSATPNYRSKASGNWNASSSWQIQIASNWYDASDFPNTSNKSVTILSGHTIETTDNNGKCRNLTVDAGGKLWKNNISSASYLYVYGNILNNGIIGSSDAGVTPSALGFDIEGANCLISGSGTFDAWRISKFTADNLTTNLVIAQDITLRYSPNTASALYNSAGVTTTFNITVNPGYNVTTPTAPINLTNCTLTLKSDASGTASLLDNGTISGMSGTNVTLERYITGSTDLNAMMYHMVSVPLTSGGTSNQFLGSYLYDYYENTNQWHGLQDATNTALDNSRGYMMYYPLAASTTLSFVGSLNSNAITPFTCLTSASGSLNDITRGWNLVPNPFPSALDWDAASGWTKTNIDGGIYFWPAGAPSNANNYVSYNNGLAITTNTSGTRYIPVGQSFFVHADGGGSPVLSMTNSVRVHNNQAFYKSASTETIPNVLRLTVNANNAVDQIALRFAEDATSGFDGNYETYKLQGGSDAPQLSSVTSDGKTLSINALPFSQSDVIVPLNFTLQANADVTFTATGMESFYMGVPVFLEDLALNTVTDLRSTPEYTFSHVSGSDENRFQLRFMGVTATPNQEEATQGSVFASNGYLFVDVPSMHQSATTINVYDALGRQLSSRKMVLNSVTQLPAPAATGVYIVRVTSGNKNFVGKVVVK